MCLLRSSSFDLGILKRQINSEENINNDLQLYFITVALLLSNPAGGEGRCEICFQSETHRNRQTSTYILSESYSFIVSNKIVPFL